LLNAPKSGVGSLEDDGTRFYVLGLAPNAARIAVRFWHVKTVAELAVNIRKYFNDFRIVHAPHEPEMFSLFRLLVATATLGKAENIPPNLGGDVMRSVIEGLPYPQTLFAASAPSKKSLTRAPPSSRHASTVTLRRRSSPCHWMKTT